MPLNTKSRAKFGYTARVGLQSVVTTNCCFRTQSRLSSRMIRRTRLWLTVQPQRRARRSSCANRNTETPSATRSKASPKSMSIAELNGVFAELVDKFNSHKSDSRDANTTARD